MKAVSYWFWIVAGVIAGLIVFAIAYQQIVDIHKTSIEHKNIEQFNEIKNIADNLCWSTSGNKREYPVSLSENVEGIYTTLDEYEEISKENLANNIVSSESNTGNYLCIKVTDKRVQCENLDCNTTMPFIGAVPEEFSLSVLVNSLTGKGKIYDYYLEFEKGGSDVLINLREEPSLIKVCNGILNIQLSGTGTCTIGGSINVKNCKGNAWNITEGKAERCSGTVESDKYISKCSTWNVESGTDGKMFTYDLYIGGVKNDSKSITCSPPQCDESTCTDWSNQGCALGGCDSTKMYQTRTCTDQYCKQLSRCVEDSSCIQLLTADNLIDCINGKGGTLYYNPSTCGPCRRQEQIFTRASSPAGPATKWDTVEKKSSGSPCGGIPCWTFGSSNFKGCRNLERLNIDYGCGLKPISGHAYEQC
jgi:hypothetical protein